MAGGVESGERDATKPRILFVATGPLTTSFGYGQRLMATLDGLQRVGNVTSALVSSSSDEATGAGYDLVFRQPRPRGFRKLGLLARSGLPQSALYFDAPALRTEMADALGSYDLVWFSRLRCWSLANGLVEAPEIVDFDDLYDRYIASAAADPYYNESWRQRVADIFLRSLDVRRWNRLQSRAAASAAAVAVCSAEDADYLDRTNVVVIPNGALDCAPAARPAPSPPTLLFLGPLDYPPNRAAARFIAHEVFPRVRERVPDAEVLLVGKAPEQVADLVTIEGIRATGWAADLDDVYNRAAIALTPLRSGAGTNIKAIEAMARGVPQVTTPFGVRGLAVQSGREVFIGTTGEELADHIVRLLTDAQLADQAGRSARAWFEEFGRWEQTSARVAEVARGVLDGGNG